MLSHNEAVLLYCASMKNFHKYDFFAHLYALQTYDVARNKNNFLRNTAHSAYAQHAECCANMRNVAYRVQNVAIETLDKSPYVIF